MKSEDDVERVHKPGGKKKRNGKKNRIMLNMLIAVAVGEDGSSDWIRPAKGTE